MSKLEINFIGLRISAQGVVAIGAAMIIVLSILLLPRF